MKRRTTIKIVTGSLPVVLLAAMAIGAQAADGAAADGIKRGAKFTDEERQALASKIELANGIMKGVDAELASRFDGAEQRRNLLQNLLSERRLDLQKMGTPKTIPQIYASLRSNRLADDKAIGSASTDVVFRPIAPCRFIDTRNVGGPITTTRSFNLGWTGNLYGGAVACAPVTLAGVTDADDIAAVAINITIVSPTGAPGFLGARPVGSANTTSLVNWYQAGVGVQVANAAVVQTLQDAGNEIEFFAVGSPQLLVDIFGVFARPGATALECNNAVSAVTSIPVNTWSAVSAICPAGYTVTGGGHYSNEGTLGYPGMWHLSIPSGNQWITYWDNQTGGARSVQAFARCCRLPGR